MSLSMAQQRRVTIMALGIMMLFGALLRLHDLGRSTITHPEMHVPGIELPYDVSAPPPRLTIWKTLTGVIAGDVHPPAYYILMFGWTKLFGTEILTLRLPSVLFGVASILLIYSLGTLTENKFTAFLAAGMLTLNGHHIFWSQAARMYAMGCFLGLLSTVLLLLLAKGSARQQVFLQFLYLGVTLIGLATEYYFWPIFVTHILWTLGGNWIKKTSMPGLLRLQIFILILGTPLLAIAAYQSRRPSYLETNLWTSLGRFLQFGFLFEPGPYYTSPTSSNSIPAAAAIFLALVALFLFVSGLVSKRNRLKENMSATGPSSIIMVLTGICVFLGILLFASLRMRWILAGPD